jgi:hypothetical protein
MANKSIVFHSWGTLCLCAIDRHSGDPDQFASSPKRLFPKCSVDESLSAFLALMFDYPRCALTNTKDSSCSYHHISFHNMFNFSLINATTVLQHLFSRRKYCQPLCSYLENTRCRTELLTSKHYAEYASVFRRRYLLQATHCAFQPSPHASPLPIPYP